MSELCWAFFYIKHTIGLLLVFNKSIEGAMQIFHLEDDGPLREIMRITLAAAEPGIVIKQFINSDDAMGYLTTGIWLAFP